VNFFELECREAYFTYVSFVILHASINVFVHFVVNTDVLMSDQTILRLFMFEFPCIIRLYYIKDQQDATLAVMFISHCKITLHVSDGFCVHLQEY
jgi:hypothetical protein